jgi:hypothetical protein
VSDRCVVNVRLGDDLVRCVPISLWRIPGPCPPGDPEPAWRAEFGGIRRTAATPYEAARLAHDAAAASRRCR